jgi:hypothetical protein
MGEGETKGITTKEIKYLFTLMDSRNQKSNLYAEKLQCQKW